jgi:hypothetical protein
MSKSTATRLTKRSKSYPIDCRKARRSSRSLLASRMLSTMALSGRTLFNHFALDWLIDFNFSIIFLFPYLYGSVFDWIMHSLSSSACFMAVEETRVTS